MSVSSIIGDSKVLICWYSRTGLTKRVVDIVAKQLGNRATLFEVKTGVNYEGLIGTMRSAWHSLAGRGKDQQLIGEPPVLADFASVIVAAPVWNYVVAMPMSSLLNVLDFQGKPVIGLATAEKDMKETMEDLRQQVKNGRFVAKDGFYAVQRQTDEGLEQHVRTWLHSS
jgi:flavodoxin